MGRSADVTDYTEPAAWARTRRPIDGATGLDPALYTDPDVHQLELDRVFERTWVCVGLTAEATTPGTLLVRQLGRRSILIAVDEDGELHGHLNSCRHRGTELAERDCNVRGTIRCPYHRWGYALDGTLLSTPRFDATTKPGFDPADHSLAPVRIATSGCLLFACLDADTPPLDVWLGDLTERLAGYDLGSWAIAETMQVDIDANWKLISENFQEYYHLPWVHPGLSGVSRVEDHYRYQGRGMYCGQTTTPVTDDDGSTWLSLAPRAGLDESDAVSGRHIAIFPNVVISILPNHAFVMRLDPDGPGRTKETCAWLLPEPLGDRRDRLDGFAALRKFWLEINGEDIDIVQRSQRGLTTASRATPQIGQIGQIGPLVPRFEEPLHRYHSILADHFTATSTDEIAIPTGDRPGTDEALGAKPNPNPPAIERR